MNRCYFVGRTTKDMELRYAQANNTVYTKFSIAVDSGYKDKKRTDFFNMTAFGKTAETLQKYVPKGTKLIIECQAVQNQYTDKNGNKVNTVDFTVMNFEFCESKNVNQNSESRPQEKPQTTDDGFMPIPENISDELPFN